jgi:phosphatidylethanolamine-binding protein (PEBP) family uncharacterized protein
VAGMERRATYWFAIVLLTAFCVVGLYFELSNSTSDSDKPALMVHFSWAGIPACGSTSPAFELDNVPDDTRQLRFMMTDLNMPSFNHGGSTVTYTGNVVEQGAVTYTGPCPPSGEHHNYRWTVQALDVAGSVLGTGNVEAVFPP